MRRPRLRLRGERLADRRQKAGLLSAMHNRSTMFLVLPCSVLLWAANKPADSSASAAPRFGSPASATAQPAVAAVAPTQAAATAPLAAQPTAAAPAASPGTNKVWCAALGGWSGADGERGDGRGWQVDDKETSNSRARSAAPARRRLLDDAQ